MTISEYLDDALLNDMVGILLEFGQDGHFVTKLLEAYSCADPNNRWEIKPFIVRTINKYKLDRKYIELLTTNPSAAQFSYEFLARWNSHPDSLKNDNNFYNSYF